MIPKQLSVSEECVHIRRLSKGRAAVGNSGVAVGEAFRAQLIKMEAPQVQFDTSMGR